MKTSKGKELVLNQQEIDLIYEVKQFATPDELLANIQFAQQAMINYEIPIAPQNSIQSKTNCLSCMEVLATVIRELDNA